MRAKIRLKWFYVWVLKATHLKFVNSLSLAIYFDMITFLLLLLWFLVPFSGPTLSIWIVLFFHCSVLLSIALLLFGCLFLHVYMYSRCLIQLSVVRVWSLVLSNSCMIAFNSNRLFVLRCPPFFDDWVSFINLWNNNNWVVLLLIVFDLSMSFWFGIVQLTCACSFYF